MTAVWRCITPFLCLLFAALSLQEGSSEVLWRAPGKDLTIQCRAESKDQETLAVKRGLNDSDVFFVHKDHPPIIKDEFKRRLQYSKDFPNVDIIIKNLSVDDTGPYWCLYQRHKFDTRTVKAKGSLLLVVSEERSECPPPAQDTFLVAFTAAAAALFCIFAGFLLWLVLKTKRFCCAAKPWPVPGNEVYEDMQGTLSR